MVVQATNRIDTVWLGYSPCIDMSQIAPVSRIVRLIYLLCFLLEDSPTGQSFYGLWSPPKLVSNNSFTSNLTMVLRCAFLSLLRFRGNSFDCRLRQNGVRSQCLLLSHSNNLLSSLALDYPPFFAYFEKVLSIPASLLDPKIVDLNNLGYDSWSVIAYQRTTVILTELVLAAAAHRYVESLPLCRTGNLVLTTTEIYPWCYKSFHTKDHFSFIVSPSWVPYRGSHTFPVQRIHVWDPSMVNSNGSKRKY